MCWLSFAYNSSNHGLALPGSWLFSGPLGMPCLIVFLLAPLSYLWKDHIGPLQQHHSQRTPLLSLWKKYRSHYPNRRLGLIYVRHWDNFRKLNVFTAIYCSRQELQTSRPFFPPSLPFTLLWMIQLSCSFILSPISPSFNLKIDQYILTPFFKKHGKLLRNGENSIS